MAHTIVGLGNPDEKYEKTRHNVGRIVLEIVRSELGFPNWVESGKYAGLISEGKIGKSKTLLLEPETYMNKSGSSVAKAAKNAKQAEKLAVIYDDIDLPLGRVRISFGRGSGGHKGIESIVRSLRTKNFLRIRVGVLPTTPTGKPRKPKGEGKVQKFILGDFKPDELKIIKKEAKKIAENIETFVSEGREVAMSRGVIVK